MKNKIIIFIILICFSLNVYSANIKLSSLGHENYGIELCHHIDGCTYYTQNTSMYLNKTKDYIIKIIYPKKEHAWGKSIYYEVLDKYMFYVWIVLFVLFLIILYNVIKLR